MAFDGERYTPALEGTIQHEHFHRYLFAAKYCRERAVLDIACGEGYGSALLGNMATKVVGVDASEDAIRHADREYSQSAGEKCVEFRLGSCEAIPLSDAEVDTVVSFETLEHVQEHAQFLAEIRRVLRPGGILVMSTPDHVVYSVENGVRNPYHVRELTQEEFRSLLLRFFPFVEMLGQKSTAGSIIAPLELTERSLEKAQFILKRSACEFSLEHRMVGAPFLIALASDKTFQWPSLSFLDDPAFIPSLEQVALPALLQRVGALEAQVQRLTNHSTANCEPIEPDSQSTHG